MFFVFSSYKKNKFLTFVMILFTILFYECDTQKSMPYITYPDDGVEVLEGSNITCLADSSCDWYLNQDEYLGTGSSVSFTAELEDYKISIINSDQMFDEIQVVVIDASIDSGDTLIIPAKIDNSKRIIGCGTFYPFLFSTKETNNNLQVNIQTKEKRGVTLVSHMQPGPPNSSLEKKMISLELNNNLLELKYLNAELTRNIKDIAADFLIGDKKDFYMADPVLGTMSPGYDIVATLKYSSEICEIWVDDETEIDESYFETFIEKTIGIALPRAQRIWGEPYDLNNDGKFTILVSGKLNSGCIAIGFFNPSDFYPYDDDSTSDFYNPTSNEMDIIYIGNPVDVTVSSAYSPNSIAATVAHEYQHIVRFSKKTYIPSLFGNEDVEQEGTAFDEGMSHLTESLVGFGLSGGNAVFVERYLSNTGIYSIKVSDIGGETDSVGKRGGTALFFSWLVEKAGGFRWSDDNGLLVDEERSSGLEFLRYTQSYSDCGWELIGSYFGESLKNLYKEYLIEQNMILSKIQSEPEIIIDSLTGEPISLHAYIGEFYFGGNFYNINGPTVELTETDITIPGWSVIFNPVFVSDDKAAVSVITADGIVGNCFMGITHNN